MCDRGEMQRAVGEKCKGGSGAGWLSVQMRIGEWGGGGGGGLFNGASGR